MKQFIPLSSLRRPKVDALTGTDLRDQLQRPLRDLRISVTDRCNFRCTYCMPREHFGREHAFLPRNELLSFEEIARLARVFAQLGVEKIRLTGGEPLLRKDLPRLIEQLAAIDGIELTLTTNGALLEREAHRLRAAGLQRLTISLDAIDASTFAAMSDSEFDLTSVLKGIEAATAAGFAPLKINCVIQRGVNEHALLDLVRYFRGSGHIVRFIEFMDVGETNAWERASVLSAQDMLARIHEHFPLEALPAQYTGEVAKRWRLCDGSLEIGVIASVTQAFCRDCTRLRLSPEGKLFTCLFATQGHDLRQQLRQGADDPTLAAWLSALWQTRQDRYSELQQPAAGKIEMSYIGG